MDKKTFNTIMFYVIGLAVILTQYLLPSYSSAIGKTFVTVIIGVGIIINVMSHFLVGVVRRYVKQGGPSDLEIIEKFKKQSLLYGILYAILTGIMLCAIVPEWKVAIISYLVFSVINGKIVSMRITQNVDR